MTCEFMIYDLRFKRSGFRQKAGRFEFRKLAALFRDASY